MTVIADHTPTLYALSADAFPVPTGREEQWRFTPLAKLQGMHTDGAQIGRAHV